MLFSSSFSHLFHIPSFFFPLQTWAYLSVMRPLSMSHSFDSSGKVYRHQLFTCCASQFSIPGHVRASSWPKRRHTPFFSCQVCDAPLSLFLLTVVAELPECVSESHTVWNGYLNLEFCTFSACLDWMEWYTFVGITTQWVCMVTRFMVSVRLRSSLRQHNPWEKKKKCNTSVLASY